MNNLVGLYANETRGWGFALHCLFVFMCVCWCVEFATFSHAPLGSGTMMFHASLTCAETLQVERSAKKTSGFERAKLKALLKIACQKGKEDIIFFKFRLAAGCNLCSSENKTHKALMECAASWISVLRHLGGEALGGASLSGTGSKQCPLRLGKVKSGETD